MSHCFLLSHWWFQGTTTVVEAHLHSRFIHLEKASARRPSVIHGQKDHIAAGRKLTPRLFGAAPVPAAEEINRDLMICHLCYKVNEGALLTLLQLLLPSPLATHPPDCCYSCQ